MDPEVGSVRPGGELEISDRLVTMVHGGIEGYRLAIHLEFIFPLHDTGCRGLLLFFSFKAFALDKAEPLRIPGVQEISADVMEGIHRLAAAKRVDGERVGTEPTSDARDEPAFAEVGDADVFVGFFGGEAVAFGEDAFGVVGGGRD